MSSKVSCLLFDFDNTLVDFSGAAKSALWKSFEDVGVKCTEEIYGIYQVVNHEHWQAFEQGKLDAKSLRYRRFEALFRQIDTLDLDPHTFNKEFLQHLILNSLAYEGVQDLLDRLKEEYVLGLVTNGLKEVQRPRLDRLNMTHYFESIIVSDEIGVAKPQEEFFTYAYNSLPKNFEKDEIMIIGDSLNSDILGGNNFGIQTCWISHGRERNSEISADFEINQVDEIEQILSV
ncbi:MAG: YjjG family noncanonical pyrimidine nucleotidase [Bacteroidota bacterium]